MSLRSLASMYGRNLGAGFVAVGVCVAGLGIAYPVAVWGFSRVTADTADGALVYSGDCLLASTELSDGRTDGPWFFGRGEGLTNMGPNNEELLNSINTRRQEIATREGVDPATIPPDALTGSGSGADSGISQEYAQLQVPRVARERGMTEDDVQALVADATVGKSFGVLGEKWVNVTKLNLSLPNGTSCESGS